ncbi:hypothetical protein HanHA300_Chr05g0180091 [Helianthus annuus]|nr:hypothetical protein HanHA300_Chr05g0180091 [Helianthus annuus]KAJ0584961.1 hypothetical protein HanHA89_Chr05g0194791 [Helianthus annuus]KAJ0750628.1 hypothetical protein HanLR1_Chr05g0184161 [Helianthus annuus]
MYENACCVRFVCHMTSWLIFRVFEYSFNHDSLVTLFFNWIQPTLASMNFELNCYVKLIVRSNLTVLALIPIVRI